MTKLQELLATAKSHQEAGRVHAAETAYREALSIDDYCAEAVLYLGSRAFERGDLESAAKQFQHALQLRPQWTEAMHSLGIVNYLMGKWQEAASFFASVLKFQPEDANTHNYLGTSLYQMGKSHEAIHCFRSALRFEPRHVDALSNLGTALREVDVLDQAVICCREAIKIDPAYASAHFNLGLALYELREFDEAADCYRQTVELQPHHAKAHAKQAMLSFLVGEFQDGWPEYEWRWKTGELPAREFSQPRWMGEALEGKTVLLHAEQGLGDTIQFVRYAWLVKARGATVVLECQPALKKLLATCAGIDRLVAAGEALPGFDFHCPLLSLPGVFQTRLETIPARVPYLFADDDLVRIWRERLAGVSGFRIGINWHGREGHWEAKRRDVPVELMAELAEVPGVRLVSLQKEGGQVENRKSKVESQEPILELGELDTAHGAFMDTAAVMMNLDLVITSDTSVAHLAGALGVPVWVALPYVPDWRWLLDRADSPWYPTMRLFRQKQAGDWEGVFEAIREALRARSTPKS
jgi:tetratricopeptide (TPR) repeat protein